MGSKNRKKIRLDGQNDMVLLWNLEAYSMIRPLQGRLEALGPIFTTNFFSGVQKQAIQLIAYRRCSEREKEWLLSQFKSLKTLILIMPSYWHGTCGRDLMGAKMPETGKLRDFEEDNEESRMSWRVFEELEKRR